MSPNKAIKPAKDGFGSSRFPVRQALCPRCSRLVPVRASTTAALKGRIVTGYHEIDGKGCLLNVVVVLPHEVLFDPPLT